MHLAKGAPFCRSEGVEDPPVEDSVHIVGECPAWAALRVIYLRDWSAWCDEDPARFPPAFRKEGLVPYDVVVERYPGRTVAADEGGPFPAHVDTRVRERRMR